MSDARRELPAWAPAAGVAVALAALVAWSFAERWTLLTASPFPVGVDGYYYPIQLRALLETGGLQYPAAPLGFWLMAPLAALTDPITGAKLGAALFGALIALPAYGVGARLGRGRGAGLIAAALAAASAGSRYLSLEFVKNGIGLTVALTAVWLVLRALERPDRGRMLGAALGLLAALLTHKMAAGVALVLAVPAILAELHARGAWRGRRALVVGLAAAAAVALIALGVAMPQRVLSPGDAALFDGLFTGEARWSAPALVRPRVTLALGHEALIGLVLAVAAIVALVRSPRTPPRAAGETAAAWAAVALALVIGLPWLDVSDAQALGFRLRIAAFVPMALAGAIAAGRLLARLPHRDLALAAVALVLALRAPGDRAEGRITTHPALVTSVQGLAGEVPVADTIVIPERHILYMVGWYTRARVSLRPERIPAAHRWRAMPLAFIGMGSELDRALTAARDEPALRPPLGLHPRHPNGFVLVAEPTWEWIVERLPPRARWRAWPTI